MGIVGLFYYFTNSLLTIIHYKIIEGPFLVHEALHSPNIMNPLSSHLVICYGCVIYVYTNQQPLIPVGGY